MTDLPKDLIFTAGKGTANRMRIQAQGNEVRLVLECADEYEAAVIFQDVHERLLAGEEIVIGGFFGKEGGSA